MTDTRSPGAYLRRCREQAGLTVTAAARKLCEFDGQVHYVAGRLIAFEDNEPGDHAPLLKLLDYSKPFPLDCLHLRQLMEATCHEDLGEAA